MKYIHQHRNGVTVVSRIKVRDGSHEVHVRLAGKRWRVIDAGLFREEAVLLFHAAVTAVIQGHGVYGCCWCGGEVQVWTKPRVKARKVKQAA